MRLISWRHVLFWCVWCGLRSSKSESEQWVWYVNIETCSYSNADHTRRMETGSLRRDSYICAEIAVFVLNLSDIIFLRTAPHTYYLIRCSKLSDSLVNILFCFALLETVLRECLTFSFFTRSCCSGRWLFLHYDLFVECAQKIGY